MRLRDWIDTLAPGELAQRCKDHGLHVARFYEAVGQRKRGSRRMSKPRPPKTVALARRMSAATGGAVSMFEILGVPDHSEAA